MRVLPQPPGRKRECARGSSALDRPFEKTSLNRLATGQRLASAGVHIARRQCSRQVVPTRLLHHLIVILIASGRICFEAGLTCRVGKILRQPAGHSWPKRVDGFDGMECVSGERLASALGMRRPELWDTNPRLAERIGAP
jgi:hypothetical protein